MLRDDKVCDARRDRIISAVFVAVIMIVVAAGFDYYYDLNDDVLMKDILSGIYTGVPETRNIQMLWPVSALICLLYRICPVIPWMGVVLCGIQYVCIFLIVCRTLSFFSKMRTKAVVLFVAAAIVFAYLLSHIVFIQYTMTAAMMAATAAYLFYTVKEGLDEKKFIRSQMVPVILVVIAFMIRSELMLMLMPLMGVAVLIRWNREKQPLAKTNIRRYLLLILTVAVLMAGAYGANSIAYSGKDWRTFGKMFDNRTDLYDYQSIPEYSSNRGFYESVGLSQSEQELLENYNYGIDDRIDGDILGKTAKYADSIRTKDTGTRLKEAFQNYIYRSFHKSDDFPWNLTMIVLYVAVLVAILMRREGSWSGNLRKAADRLGFLFIVRSALWMYILYEGRYPERITHSLYFMEMCILMAMLLVEFRCKVRDQSFMMMLNGVIAAVALCILTPYDISDVIKAEEQRDYENKDEEAIRSYCALHSGNFYFEDVYSTVDFSQKIFGTDAISAADKKTTGMSNYDILGGWACGSPLWRKKLANAGIQDVSDSLISGGNVYLISENSEDLSWLTDYYAGTGIKAGVEKTDDINSSYGVYRVSAD